jgi:hypothetical protein
MPLQIITIYCLCADFLFAQGQKDDPKAQMTQAEVMTSALVAACFFHGNQQQACQFLKEHGYIPKMLSRSRFNRCLHRIPESVWHSFFASLTPREEGNKTYLMDSCPIAVCDNLRISRCRLYQQEVYRGYCASKRRYFYGVKLHLIVTSDGRPAGMALSSGSKGDNTLLNWLGSSLPPGSTLYADKGYTDYGREDALAGQGVSLIALRRENSKRPHTEEVSAVCKKARKRIESVFSTLHQRMSRCIHAVTAKGFELKIILNVLALTICH